MPGIVGCITKLPHERAEQQLLQMADACHREEFYVTGTLAEDSLGLYVGWTAHKDSFCSRMPLRSEKGDVVLIFYGEDFAGPEIVQELKKRGHDLDASEASYLVHLYEEYPVFLPRLNGRFHGLLIDRNRGTAMLFNDRFGMQRIYYHQSKDGFYFGAEAKAILAVCPELRRIDPRGLGEFVACDAVLENRTVFDGIHVLPPASAWMFRNGSLEAKSTYFDPREWEEQETLDAESYYAQIRDAFTANLTRYFSGPQPVAMSLTGGLDTRMILAWRKPAPYELPCYTFGSMFRENQDVRMARRVADMCRQPHHVITPGPEFLSRFPHYAERAVYLSDGCVDVGRAPDLYLNEKAREIAPVRMTGNYGGEILRAIRGFKPEMPAAGLFCPETSSCLQQAAETYARVSRCHPLSFAAFKQAPWYNYGVLALEQTQLSMRSPYLDNDFVRTVFRSPASALASNDVSLRLIADGNRTLLRIPTDRGLAGKRGRFLALACRGMLEFLFKAEYAYDIGMPQWLALLDHALSPLSLEHAFLGRHKVFHFRVWYRDALAGYVQETLLDPRALSRPYIERKGLEAVVRGHLKGDRNYTTELHKMLTIEILHRLFLDNPERGSSSERSGTPRVTRVDQLTTA